MCLTMINPATSWFKIVEQATVYLVTTVLPAGKGKKGHIFNQQYGSKTLF
jgi:hypothetical protein